MSVNSEQEKLLQIYREVLPSVQRVGVYPNITASSKQNPYLSLLYKEFPLQVYSPSPFFPLFLFSPRSIIMHYNWLECKDLRGIMVLLVKLLPLFLFMLLGGNVIWTVHNHAPHHGKYPKLNRQIRQLFASRCRLMLVHSEAAREAVLSRFSVPKEKVQIVKHPHYPVERIPCEEAAERLATILPVTKRPLFLMYGYIAAYKGIEEIVDLFSNSDATLIVAGKIKEQDYFEVVQTKAQKCENIVLLPRFITTEEEEALFSYVDAVLFNFTTILTSGSLILAGSYGAHIITKSFDSAIPEEFKVTTFDTIQQLKTILAEYHA